MTREDKDEPEGGFAQLFCSYFQKAKLSQLHLASRIGVKDAKSLRSWLQGKTFPTEDNTYKLINFFFQWGVISSLDQAKSLWELAGQGRNYKGYSEEFDPSNIRSLGDHNSHTRSIKELLVIEPLMLSSNQIRVNDTVTAQFIIRNSSDRSILVRELAACARLGDKWDGLWADFPHVKNLPIKPGGEYHYRQTQVFTQSGNYFAEAVVLLEGKEQWLGIPRYLEGDPALNTQPNYPRIFFDVA
jgi:transcriptional regulator with XRE-family HTH domain